MRKGKRRIKEGERRAVEESSEAGWKVVEEKEKFEGEKKKKKTHQKKICVLSVSSFKDNSKSAGPASTSK